MPATTARFALYGKPLPKIEDTIRLGEWMRAAVVGKAGRMLGEDRVPPLLSGHGLADENLHAHAFYLPEANDRGLLTHVLIHATGGLDTAAQRVLGNLTQLWGPDGGEWQIILENIGLAETFADASALCRESRAWRTLTPYLHPWHAKKNFGYTEQIRLECEKRGLPRPEQVLFLPDVEMEGRRLRAIHFRRFRSKRGLTQPDRTGTFVHLRFLEPVAGPLALGFGCHFGLGLFRPAQPDGA